MHCQRLVAVLHLTLMTSAYSLVLSLVQLQLLQGVCAKLLATLARLPNLQLPLSACT